MSVWGFFCFILCFSFFLKCLNLAVNNLTLGLVHLRPFAWQQRKNTFATVKRYEGNISLDSKAKICRFFILYFSSNCPHLLLYSTMICSKLRKTHVYLITLRMAVFHRRFPLWQLVLLSRESHRLCITWHFLALEVLRKSVKLETNSTIIIFPWFGHDHVLPGDTDCAMMNH